MLVSDGYVESSVEDDEGFIEARADAQRWTGEMLHAVYSQTSWLALATLITSRFPPTSITSPSPGLSKAWPSPFTCIVSPSSAVLVGTIVAAGAPEGKRRSAVAAKTRGCGAPHT